MLEQISNKLLLTNLKHTKVTQDHQKFKLQFLLEELTI